MSQKARKLRATARVAISEQEETGNHRSVTVHAADTQELTQVIQPIAITPRTEPVAPFTARVEAVRYLPHLSNPTGLDHPFWTWGYQIKITNHARFGGTLLRRRWIIKPLGHRAEYTDGFGIGGEQVHFSAGDTHEYFSGVPLPTPDGGTMEGSYRLLLANGSLIDVEVESFNLPTAKTANPSHRQPSSSPTNADISRLNGIISRYVEGCRQVNKTTTLDVNEIPSAFRWYFQTLLLGKNFNSIKENQLSSVDIRQAIGASIISVADLEYTDIFLYGKDFDTLRVQLLHNLSTFDFLVSRGLKEESARYLARKFDRAIKDELTETHNARAQRPSKTDELPLTLPDHAPRLYADRPKGQNIVDFLRDPDGWGPYVTAGVLTRPDLRRLDPDGEMALRNWLRNHRLPEDIRIPTKTEAIDALVKASLADDEELRATRRLVRAGERRQPIKHHS